MDQSTTEINRYQDPPSDAPTTIIPLCNGHSGQIVADTWSIYQFGLQTEGNEGPADLEKVRSAASYSFSIDGRDIADIDAGWTGIERSESGYELNWRYSTPPLSPGSHAVEFEMAFDESVRTRGANSRVWEGTYRFTDGFAVLSESGHHGTVESSRDGVRFLSRPGAEEG